MTEFSTKIRRLNHQSTCAGNIARELTSAKILRRLQRLPFEGSMGKRILRSGILLSWGVLLGCMAGLAATKPDSRLEKTYRFQQSGWTYVHLEGSPSEIGYQHGYVLAPEIQDAFEAIKLFDTHQSQKDWEFFRTTAKQMLWPHIDAEYQQELQGIADGVKAHGVDLDVWDIVALNAFEEVPDYYLPWLAKQN